MMPAKLKSNPPLNENTMSSPAAPANPLLTGSILPLLLRFTLPNMVAMLATALAAIAETSYVGHFGTPALAGMALVFPFVMLQTMMSAGAMGGGVSSAVSRALGAGDADRANVLAVHALWIGLALGSVFTILMETFGLSMMAALGGKDEALSQAFAYCEVAFSGSVFVWIMNTLSSVIRGSGNMRVPSATLFIVAFAQVLLGGALGLGWGPFPQWGMHGVAAGGVLANLGGGLFLWFYLASGRSKIQLHMSRTTLSSPTGSSSVTAARFDADYLKNPPPTYPAMSRKLQEEGKVLLQVKVTAAGTAEQVQIKRSSGYPRLDEAALNTVLRWRFVPARQGSEVIASNVVVPIVFRLDS